MIFIKKNDIIYLTIPTGLSFFYKMMHTGGLFITNSMINEYLTIEQQIKLLKTRGLLISEEKEFSDFLLKNNYYRIKGYTLTLRNQDVFHNNANCEILYDIYNADVEMRNIILLASQIIETNAKSYFTYEFAKLTHDNPNICVSDFYLDASNYILSPIKYKDMSELSTLTDKNKKNFIDTINKIGKQIKNQSPYELSLQHYTKKYEGKLPLWIYVEYMTLTDISILFNFLPDSVKSDICKDFNIFNSNILSKHLHCISNLRNLCAHNYRLYNRTFKRKPTLSKTQKQMIIGNNDKLFSYLLIIKQLMNNNNHYTNIYNRIVNTVTKYSRIDLKCYGFPGNWSECLR